MNKIKISLVKNSLDQEKSVRMVVQVIFNDNKDPDTLLECVLDSVNELDQLIGYEKNIRNEVSPVPIVPNLSIVDSIDKFYELQIQRYDELGENVKGTVEEDELDDKIFNYRSSHGIAWVLRGQEITDGLMGLADGKYEFSANDDFKQCQYIIDIDSYFQELKKARVEYLKITSHN
ncbi:hypothetical protein [Kiloniella sp. EL199]|uniref:hypothetical protein n=1 Tax=Kiloniella sp. EL199 TaxID=2107581 RepID=UPI000EA040C1|nr:hypothetical protein [Kiloniella sp. EL199]